MEGSSEEYWTMGASLIQLCQIGEDGYFNCKTLMLRKIMTLLKVGVPANFVPAAAVIRRGQVLLVMIGRKGYVGG